MNVGFFQFDITFGDKERNLNKVMGALGQVDFDLMVLPELFTTGSIFVSSREAMAFAEPVPDGPTTRALMGMARQKQAYIVAGLAELEEERLYNTAIIVGPGGFLGKHRKIHLPTPEIPIFHRGEELRVFDLAGVKVGVVICFESWFPEPSRLLTLKGAQILCSPANFAGRWNAGTVSTRAAENMVYAISANRIGMEVRNGRIALFRGESQIVGCDGATLYRAGDAESLVIHEIQPEEALVKRSKLCPDLYRELGRYNIYELD